MFHTPLYRWRLCAVLLVTFALVTGFVLRAPWLVTAGAPDPVMAAWAKAQAAGSYHFTSDVVQITMPTAKVTNVGRSSRTEELHLDWPDRSAPADRRDAALVGRWQCAPSQQRPGHQSRRRQDLCPARWAFGELSRAVGREARLCGRWPGPAR